MSCVEIEDFVINKGFDNEFLITIKQDDNTLAMVIDDTDVFTFYLYDYETKSLLKEFTSTDTVDGSIVPTDKPNGQVTITMKKDFVDTLIGKRGSYADRYYLKPIHYGILKATTLSNGNFIAKIDEVFID